MDILFAASSGSEYIEEDDGGASPGGEDVGGSDDYEFSEGGDGGVLSKDEGVLQVFTSSSCDEGDDGSSSQKDSDKDRECGVQNGGEGVGVSLSSNA